MEGACRPGAEMAMRITERGVRVGALAHPYRTPSLSLYVNTDADTRAKPYTVSSQMIGGRNLTSIQHTTPYSLTKPPPTTSSS